MKLSNIFEQGNAICVYPAGSKDVPVGQTVALIVEEEGDVAAFKDYTPGGRCCPHVCTLCCHRHDPCVTSFTKSCQQ